MMCLHMYDEDDSSVDCSPHVADASSRSRRTDDLTQIITRSKSEHVTSGSNDDLLRVVADSCAITYTISMICSPNPPSMDLGSTPPLALMRHPNAMLHCKIKCATTQASNFDALSA